MRYAGKSLGFIALILIMLHGAVAQGASYTGQLLFTPPPDASDGLAMTGDKWPTYNASFSWTVSNADASHPGYAWRYDYEYKLTSSGKLQSGLSHLILQTSTSFNPTTDMTGLTGANIESYGSQTIQSGNPNMPANAWGLRFDPVGSNSFDMKWSFYSSRAPVWGDFYAKGGGNPTDTASNKGFGQDISQLYLPANDSLEFHILRPDTFSASGGLGAVPLPSSLIMGGVLLGVCGIVRHLRRGA